MCRGRTPRQATQARGRHLARQPAPTILPPQEADTPVVLRSVHLAALVLTRVVVEEAEATSVAAVEEAVLQAITNLS